MRLADILAVERITTSLEGSDKSTVLRALAELFVSGGSPLGADEIFRVFMEREALASTGAGSGVAIPHGRLSVIDKVQAAIGIHVRGVPFDSVDGRAVHIFVAVLAPEKQPSEHLKALRRISRILMVESNREALVRAATPRAVYDMVIAQDER